MPSDRARLGLALGQKSRQVNLVDETFLRRRRSRSRSGSLFETRARTAINKTLKHFLSAYRPESPGRRGQPASQPAAAAGRKVSIFERQHLLRAEPAHACTTPAVITSSNFHFSLSFPSPPLLPPPPQDAKALPRFIYTKFKAERLAARDDPENNASRTER